MSDNKQTAEDERAEAALIDAVVAYGEACGHGDASECGAKMERVEAAIGGLVAALASKPVPLMANGLTEEETSATASVSGLSSAPAQPVREPMSVESFDVIRGNLLAQGYSGRGMEWAVKEATERHHGITKE